MEIVFARNLKKRRQELDMTQAMLGEAIGYSEKRKEANPSICN